MTRVERITENNKGRMLKQLQKDPVRHVFADYDLKHDQEHTTAHAVFKNGVLDGYILTYTGTDVPSVILETDHTSAAEQLIKHAPNDNFILHCPPNILAEIKKRYPAAKHYFENWMLVKKGKANIFTSPLVRKLQNKRGRPPTLKAPSDQKGST